MKSIGVLFLLGFSVCRIEAFSPSFDRTSSIIHGTRESVLRAKPNGDYIKNGEIDVISRRRAASLIVAAGFSPFVPSAANAATPKKNAEEKVAAASTSSSSTVASGTVGPNLVPLSIIAGGLVSAKAATKKEESSSSLYVEAIPYGMREGRNYWNGIDLAAARAASKSTTVGSASNTTKLSATNAAVKSSNVQASKEKKNAVSITDISSAFFIESAPKEKAEAPRSKEPLTSSLRNLLVKSEATMTNEGISSDTSDRAMSTTTEDANQKLTDDELMVLEAQREAEEAELLLREAEAEATRIDQELAKLGISSSILPLVSEEVDSSKEESPYWQEIEVKVLKKSTNSSAESFTDTELDDTNSPKVTATTSPKSQTGTEANAKTPHLDAQPSPPKTSRVPFSKLAQTIPPVSRVNRAPKSINSSLSYLASLPSNTRPKSTAQPPVDSSPTPISTAGAKGQSVSPVNAVPKSTNEDPEKSQPSPMTVIASTKPIKSTKKVEPKKKTEKAPGNRKQTRTAEVPFSKITETIPPVKRVTAASKPVDNSTSKPVTRTTNLKELLSSK